MFWLVNLLWFGKAVFMNPLHLSVLYSLQKIQRLHKSFCILANFKQLVLVILKVLYGKINA